MEKKNYRVETLTPKEAGKIIGKGAEYIRAGLRLKIFDFGSAIPPQKEGGNWNYNIIKSKFFEYANIKEKRYYIKKRNTTQSILRGNKDGRIHNDK